LSMEMMKNSIKTFQTLKGLTALPKASLQQQTPMQSGPKAQKKAR